MNSQPDGISNPYQNDELSLGDIWRILRGHVLLISIVTFIGGAIAAAISLSITPIFRAESVLTLVDDSSDSMGRGGLAGQLGGLASFAGVNLGSASNRAEALGTLNSKQLVETYIKTKNLLPVLFNSSWDESKNDWKAGLVKQPTAWEATELFTKGIRKVVEDKKSGLVTLTVEWKDAATAAQWANDLVWLANQTLRQRAIGKSEANLAYLNDQLEKTSVVELRQAIFRLIESEVKNVMVAQGNENFAFKVIDPAVTPEKKAKPRRTLISLAGAVLGFLLASIWALLRFGKSGSTRSERLDYK